MVSIPNDAAQGGHTQRASHSGDAAIKIWLYTVAALVLLMIVVGGATRLTNSGLSITEWQPIIGTVPPLSDADWHQVAARSEFGMTVAQWVFITAVHAAMHLGRIQLLRALLEGEHDRPC